MGIQKELAKHFFPQDRSEFNKLYASDPNAKGMTRQEHIDRAVILVNGVAVGKRLWPILCPNSSFEETLFQFKPWLASDEAFEEWWRLEPWERWQSMTEGT